MHSTSSSDSSLACLRIIFVTDSGTVHIYMECQLVTHTWCRSFFHVVKRMFLHARSPQLRRSEVNTRFSRRVAARAAGSAPNVMRETSYTNQIVACGDFASFIPPPTILITDVYNISATRGRKRHALEPARGLV